VVSIEPVPPQEAVDSGRVILRDGRTAELRRATPADGELMRAFLARVSREALTRRFLAGVSAEVALGSLLPKGDATVLVVLAGGPEIIATGCFVPDAGPHPSAAEVALLVEDDQVGRGIGTLLLERLALLAAQQGIGRFRALTQPDNTAMLEVFRESGFKVRATREDGAVEIEFSIEPTQESVDRAAMRDRVATIASLRPLFQPRAVAVIGASRDPDAIGHRILEYLVRSRFSGPVYPVNPHAEVVASIPAHPSVLEIPGPVDLAVIAVPTAAVPGVIEQCGKKGVRAAIVISAGFAETGPEGRARQDELVRRARGYGMRLVGPNCLGVLNADPDVRLNASFSPVFPHWGPVAMSSQSGALGLAVLEYADEMGLGLASFVSVGNKADVSGNDLVQYWGEDPAIRVILLYLESFGNPRRFARLARAVGRGKPIVAVKAGRTAAGRRAAGSHTAALAAGETAVEALFEQAGVIRADTLEEMFDVAALLASQPLPAGPRVAIVTNAGGPAILAADALAAAGLQVPEPTPALEARLRAVLPASASVRNPVDMIASAGPAEYRAALGAVLADPGFDAVLAIFVPVGLCSPADAAGAVSAAVSEARAAGCRKPVAACVMSGTAQPRPLPCGDEQIPAYRFPEAAARAMARAHTYARWRESPLGDIPVLPGFDGALARSLCRTALARGGGYLQPDEVQRLLEAAGLPVAAGVVAPDADAAAAAAERLGFPVVVKVVARTLTHKSDVGGVQLDLRDAAAVRAACARIEEGLRAAGQPDERRGFLVQPQVGGGTELFVGVTEDPSFGPLVGFGLGGTLVELLRDVAFRITPLTDRDADAMVHAIRGFPLLAGYRGRPPADLASVRDVLLRVSGLVEAVPEIAELDLNPLLALPVGQGCRILDARVRVG
jgi:acetyl coenzyme A synthetase (ADP forming)-like protein